MKAKKNIYCLINCVSFCVVHYYSGTDLLSDVIHLVDKNTQIYVLLRRRNHNLATFFMDVALTLKKLKPCKKEEVKEEVKEDDIYLKLGHLKNSNNLFLTDGQTDKQTYRHTDRHCGS